MAERWITIGSLVDIHGFDDVDFTVAMDTDGIPIAIGAPTAQDHAAQLANVTEALRVATARAFHFSSF